VPVLWVAAAALAVAVVTCHLLSRGCTSAPLAHPRAVTGQPPASAEARAARQEEESALHASKHLNTAPRAARAAAGPAAGAAAGAGAGASTSSEGDSHSEDGGAAAAAAGGPAGGGAKPKRQRKIPKLPMVRHCKKWYRARLLKEATARVLLGARRALAPPAGAVAATGPVGLGSAVRTLMLPCQFAADRLSKRVSQSRAGISQPVLDVFKERVSQSPSRHA